MKWLSRGRPRSSRARSANGSPTNVAVRPLGPLHDHATVGVWHSIQRVRGSCTCPSWTEVALAPNESFCTYGCTNACTQDARRAEIHFAAGVRFGNGAPTDVVARPPDNSARPASGIVRRPVQHKWDLIKLQFSDLGGIREIGLQFTQFRFRLTPDRDPERQFDSRPRLVLPSTESKFQMHPDRDFASPAAS